MHYAKKNGHISNPFSVIHLFYGTHSSGGAMRLDALIQI